MDNDDKPIGTILNRREVLAALGLAGVGGLLGSKASAQNTLPSCVVRPALTEGPFFLWMPSSTAPTSAPTRSRVW
jgi:hypothetical protein